jgi:D-inositol-3-phosphate glycosyltransferase
MKSIDGAVVLSESVKYDVEDYRKDIPVCVAPHPVFDTYGRKLTRNEALSALRLDPEYSYLLFFGFIRDYKGLDLLIRAFSDKRLKSKKLKLIVAGEFYEDKKPYLDMIRESGRENEIIIFDRFIPDNEVALFFSGADLVVQPYKSATQSGVTQIAYHFDKPMLVTNVGGLNETVSHARGGYVVDPEAQSIANAIFDYFENNRKASFSDCVKKDKEKFSWNKMTNSITEVFYKIMLKQLIKAL